MGIFKRIVAGIMSSVMIVGAFATVTVSAETPPIPFNSTMYTDANCIVDNSAKITSEESFGNGAINLYGAQITSDGVRKTGASKRQTFNMQIAVGSSEGRLFVYSKPSSNGLDYAVHSIKDIAAEFEKDHPGWRVAVVTNASFFDNSTSTSNGGNKNIGEPEDIYVEDGKTLKTWMDTSKVGRGVIGLKNDGSMIYYTQETSKTTNYNNSKTSSTKYSFSSKYSLEVLGENKTNEVYSYSAIAGGAYDYTNEPIFVTSAMGERDLKGATIYVVKCTEHRRAHTGVNNKEIGSKTYFVEGEITKVTNIDTVKKDFNTTSMKPTSSRYVYIATEDKLEHLQVGTTVRINKKLSGKWADVEYAFGFKQQILLEGRPLFNNALQQQYGDKKTGSWNAWTDDVYYASYGTNRTAVGFKADGTPVVIAAPRNPNGTTGKDKAESGITYYEMAWYMKELGCVNAFMLDCGGSTGMYKKSDGSDEYEVACCEPLHEYPKRDVANALILAYPVEGVEEATDAKIEDPAFTPGYISSTKATWYSGVTDLRSLKTVNTKSNKTLQKNTAFKGKYFTLSQSSTTYTFTPKSTSKIASGYKSVYAYRKLGYTVAEGKSYSYYVKLATKTSGKYTSFLFAELPSNTASKKKLNNFAVIGGAFSNNGDNKGYSDIRVGYGRVEGGTSDIKGSNKKIKLFLETVGSLKYAYFKIEINGLKYTVQVKNSAGKWVSIGKTYSLPKGSQLILGCASWKDSNSSTKFSSARAMSVNDPIIVDRTNIKSNITKAGTLKAIDYTPESWAVLSAALSKAKYANNLTAQTLINSANTKLASAMKVLVKKKDLAAAYISEYEALDKSELDPACLEEYTSAYEMLIAARDANDAVALGTAIDQYEEAFANLAKIMWT